MSTNNCPLTICFVAGKSGGHITPCLTLAQQWRQQHPSGQILFISTNTPLDRTLATNPVVDQNYFFTLSNVPWRTPHVYPKFLYQLLSCLTRSYKILKKARPERIISTGGHIAFPVVLAAWLLRIPIELWELNAEPGRTIALLARLAATINICFSEAQTSLPAHKCVVRDYPLRYTPADKVSQTSAQEHLGLDPKRITIFILGGSQGSAELNAIVAALIAKHPQLAHKIQCIHQTGTVDKTAWHSWYAQHNIPALVFTYHDKLAPYFCAADIVISRAGAGGIFESAFFGKKTILVPLQTQQTNHQLKNAYAQLKQYPEQYFVAKTQEAAVILLHEAFWSPHRHPQTFFSQ